MGEGREGPGGTTPVHPGNRLLGLWTPEQIGDRNMQGSSRVSGPGGKASQKKADKAFLPDLMPFTSLWPHSSSPVINLQQEGTSRHSLRNRQDNSGGPICTTQKLVEI